ncbi:unnamed protein product, partial [Laminaria digitata]
STSTRIRRYGSWSWSCKLVDLCEFSLQGWGWSGRSTGAWGPWSKAEAELAAACWLRPGV